MRFSTFTGAEDHIRYEHLEHKSFAELFALKRETEQQLNALRKKEPSARKKSSTAYRAWIGRNVECIDHLDKIREEIVRRKERALEAGINVFALDWKIRLI